MAPTIEVVIRSTKCFEQQSDSNKEMGELNFVW